MRHTALTFTVWTLLAVGATATAQAAPLVSIRTDPAVPAPGAESVTTTLKVNR
jgi:hypothetical protein